MNPLLQNSILPYEAIDFSKIKVADYIPALDTAIVEANKNLDLIKKEKSPTFLNVIEAMETAPDRLDHVVEIFYALHSAECTDELSDIAEEFNQKITKFSSNLSLDKDLFSQVKKIYDMRERLSLSPEEAVLLENTYQDFTRNGALLDSDAKNKLRNIDQNLAKLSLNFQENSRKEIAKYKLVIESQEDLKGLPEGIIEAAAEASTEKFGDDGAGKWVFTLEYPSYGPFIQYCENRSLREEIWRAATSKCVEGEFDNRENIIEILKNKKERALLLGYKDHPEFVLEKRMAKKPETVLGFIDDMVNKASKNAKADFDKLKKLKKELSGNEDFAPWDAAFYSELLKKKELDFDDEALRPYFKLENVVNGIFDIVKKLYGLNFKKLNDIPVYHPDVKVFEVTDKDNKHIGLFYGDYFPRKEKRSGAWMTTFRNIGLQFGEERRPFVCNVCNFTKPTATKPSLLTLNEVLTLFHEFGHGLHGLLGTSKYKSIAGTNVHWDFVELPSQIMENWVMEKECLDMFAKHYETGETIPSDLIKKIKKNNQFLAGLATFRQLSFAHLDMEWHLADPSKINDIRGFEKMALKKFSFYDEVPEAKDSMSCAFGHIFSGGYSAGYYSYKWAEVLDADAFELFKEKGIFNKEVALSFKENILEKGGSEEPMELYKNFRGHEPSVDALLKRGGLV